MRHFRVAFRSLSRTPLVSAVAVLSLALGMGANAAIFSVYERMLLRPLPVPEPDRLVHLLNPGPKSGSQSSGAPGGIEAVWSYPLFRDLERAELPAFSGLAAEVFFSANLAYGGDTLSGLAATVSGGYFQTLGLQPAAGRLFGPDDDRQRDAHPVVVLDHAYWQTRFGGDPGVVGKPLKVNGQLLTIVGVLPEAFSGRTVGSRPRVYVPLTQHASVMPNRDSFEQRREYFLYVFGRLAPGVSIQQATAAVNVPYRAIVREVELPLQEGGSEAYLREFAAKEVVLEPGKYGQSTAREEVEAPLSLLLVLTALVLAIAAANITNLLLVRATLRAAEISVRMSLGAQRRQVVGLLLAESALLAVAGAAVGFGVAHLTLFLFRRMLPADSDARGLLALDPRSWLFLAGLTVLVALVGLVPALQSTRSDLATMLRSQGRVSGSRAAGRLRNGMATVQIALSLTLLVAAGLFVRSLSNVGGVDLGLDVERLAVFGISPELDGLEPAQSQALFERLETEIAALPGVTAVATSMVPLVAGSSWGNNVSVEGFEPGPDDDTNARFDEIGPGHFRTLGIPLLAGRELERGDVAGAPRVVLVNEEFARKFGLGRDAVGKRMARGSGGDLDMEIVGLVANTAYADVKDEAQPLMFLPWRQDETLGSINFYVRTDGDPARLLEPLRRTVGKVAPGLPLESLSTMQTRVRENVFLDRLLSALSAGFALLATVLAAIGLYGVVAYAVAQRTHEIGVRVALGAGPAEVRSLVLRQVAVIGGIGALVGLVAGAALGRVAGAVLYQLDGLDPVAFGAALGVLVAVVLAAGLVPARRASRIDPVVALRGD
jgi:predicted permease